MSARPRFANAASLSVVWAVCSLALACATTASAPATGPLTADAAQAKGTIHIVTTDPDGDTRVKPIWILSQDDAIYIRTSGSRWFANIERDPNVVIRVDGADYPLRAQKVSDEAVREKVTQAFRDKYGFSDAFIGLFRGSGAHILRLLPR